MRSIYLCFLFSIFCSQISLAQEIYIVGECQKGDIAKVTSLISGLNNTSKPKKVIIYIPGRSEPFILKRKNPKSAAQLDAELSHYERQKITSRITDNEINEVKDKIEKTSRNILITYNTSDFYTSNYYYNDFEKLLAYVNDPSNKRIKYTFLLVFKKAKPSIKILSPESGKTFYSKIIGSAKSSCLLRIIQVRINNGDWEPAVGTNNWESIISLDRVDRIEARVIDELNDTSEIAVVTNITKQRIKVPALDYVYPTKIKNVTPQCINNDGYSFSFKIALDPAVEIDKLKFILENAKGELLYETMINQIEHSSIRKIPRNGYDEYCFFMVYSILKVKSPCAINEKDNYYYHFKYMDDNKDIKMPPKILIHHSSFDAGFTYEHCDCN